MLLDSFSSLLLDGNVFPNMTIASLCLLITWTKESICDSTFLHRSSSAAAARAEFLDCLMYSRVMVVAATTKMIVSPKRSAPSSMAAFSSSFGTSRGFPERGKAISELINHESN